MSSWWDDFWSAVGEAVEEGAQAAGDTAEAVADAVAEVVEEIVETVTQGAEQAWQDTKTTVMEVSTDLGLVDAAVTAEQMLQDAKAMPREAADWVLDTIRDVVREPTEPDTSWAAPIREVTREAVRTVVEAGLPGAISGDQEPVGDAGGAAADTSAEMVDAAGDAAAPAGMAGWLVEESAAWYGDALRDAAALYTEVAGPDRSGLATSAGRAEVEEAAARAVEMTGGPSIASDPEVAVAEPGVAPVPVADARAAALHRLREAVLVPRHERVEQLRGLRDAEGSAVGVDPGAAIETLRGLVTEQAAGHGALLAVAAARGAVMRDAAGDAGGRGSVARVLEESARTEMVVAEVAAAEAGFLAAEAARARAAAVEAESSGDPAAERLGHIADGLSFVCDRSLAAVEAARGSAVETIATSEQIAEVRPDLVTADTVTAVADLADLTETVADPDEGFGTGAEEAADTGAPPLTEPGPAPADGLPDDELGARSDTEPEPEPLPEPEPVLELDTLPEEPSHPDEPEPVG